MSLQAPPLERVSNVCRSGSCLNWIIFDRNFVQKTFGYTRITSASREYGQDVAHELLSSPNITITEAGYVYIYLSNEETTPNLRI